jgi:hypothetical protein
MLLEGVARVIRETPETQEIPEMQETPEMQGLAGPGGLPGVVAEGAMVE